MVNELMTGANTGNELRKAKKYNEALEKYFENETWDESLWNVAGIVNCYRNLKDFKGAKQILNDYIRKNGDDFLQKDDKIEGRWLKSEFLNVYTNYYLREEYIKEDKKLIDKKVLNAIKAAKKIVEFDCGSYNLSQIKRCLFTDEVITKFPVELNELIEKIDYNERRYNADLFAADSTNKKYIDSFYVSYIKTKMNLLYNDGKYEKALDTYNSIDKKLITIELERIKANVLVAMGRNDEAIELLEQSLIKFGKKFYVYAEIADIYNGIGDYNNALKYYYTACDNVKKLDFAYRILIKIANLLLETDKEKARKHLNLHMLIAKEHEKDHWSLKKDVIELDKKLAEYRELDLDDKKTLEKEMRKMWKDEAKLNKTEYTGTVSKVFDKGFGFIAFDEANREIFFKNKNGEFEKGDKVSFVVEKSYDRKKEEFSEIADNVKKLSLN